MQNLFVLENKLTAQDLQLSGGEQCSQIQDRGGKKKKTLKIGTAGNHQTHVCFIGHLLVRKQQLR